MMDRKISLIGACLNLAGVAVFALCMFTGPLLLCYVSSIFIAWGLVLMTAGYYGHGRKDAAVAGLCALVFCGMYALCNSLVYYIQITSVSGAALSPREAVMLDYTRFGLMFNVDMLGYCLMAVATFFAGLTITVRDRGDKWLKGLLLAHGAFFTCAIPPIFGVFSADMTGAAWIGTAVLEFWCLYFIPIGILSIRYFYKAAR